MATFTYRIQMRRDSAADWTSNDPTLAEGEFGYETDTTKMKNGDGSTAWTSLAYWPLAIDGNLVVSGTSAPVTINGTSGLLTIQQSASARAYIGAGNQVVSGGAETDMGLQSPGGNMLFATNGTTEQLRIESGGDIGVQETAPDAQLCINQGAADDNILSFKSSDVAHGYVQDDETDTYFSIRKRDATGGGVWLKTYTDGNETFPIGFQMDAFVASVADTASNANALGMINLYAAQHTGNTQENVAAAGNVFTIRRYFGSVTAAAFIVKGNGDLLYDGSAASFDGEMDAMACHDMTQVISNNYEKVMEYSRDKLVKLGVMSEDGFISIRNSRMLELGAIGELYKITAYLLDKMGLTYQDVKEELTEGNNGDDLRSNNRRKQRGSKNNQKN